MVVKGNIKKIKNLMDGSQGDRTLVVMSSGTKIFALPLRYAVNESFE